MVTSVGVQQPGGIDADDDVDTRRNQECREIQRSSRSHGKTNIKGIPNSRHQPSRQHKGHASHRLVGHVRDSQIATGSPHEDRDGEKLSGNSVVSECPDNKREEAGKSKRADVAPELAPGADVQLRIGQGFLDFSPVELGGTVVASVYLGPRPHQLSVVIVEKPCALVAVGEKEEDGYRDDYADETYSLIQYM